MTKYIIVAEEELEDYVDGTAYKSLAKAKVEAAKKTIRDEANYVVAKVVVVYAPELDIVEVRV